MNKLCTCINTYINTCINTYHCETKSMEETQFWTTSYNTRGYIVRVLGTSKNIEDVLRGFFDRSVIGWGEYSSYDSWRAEVICMHEPVCTKCHGEREKSTINK